MSNTINLGHGAWIHLLAGFLLSQLSYAGSLQVINDSSVLHYFDFANIDGEMVQDRSRRTADGNSHSVETVEGAIGKGGKFDGTGRVSVNGISRVSEYTAMAWIRIEDYGEGPLPMLVFEKSSAYYMNVLSVSGGNKVRGHMRVGGHFTDGEKAKWEYLDTPDVLPLGDWFHAACTFEGGMLKLYLNGEKVSEKAIRPILLDTDEELTWGALWKGERNRYQGFFEGTLDECALLARALTEEEIRAVYLGYGKSPE